MRIGVKVQGLERVQSSLDKLTGPQVRGAQARAINDAAYEYQRAYKTEMASVFDRPTPYVLNSVRVKQANAGRLEARIEPEYRGGKGIDPKKILSAQAQGGRRRDKKSEVLLRAVNILPNGYQTVIPATPFPGSTDGHGNISGGFMQQLLSYLQAMRTGGQGYDMNMSKAGKDKVHQYGSARAARKKIAGPRIGRRYFIAYGKLRGSGRLTSGTRREDERANNLPPGIWAVVGRTGADVRPVLLFTRAASYKPRVDLAVVAQHADIGNYLASRMRYRIRQAAGD